ncbi:MAG: GNAT family N-acetyltransferase [Gammaproteobacteria bacterium]
MSVTIDRAGPEDLDTLVPLFDAYRQFYRKASDPARAKSFLQSRLVAGESVAFIARLGGRAVGFTQLYPFFSSTRMARLWLLNDLFVRDDARDQGVGAALLDAAHDYAASTGACELILETANENPARRLYERKGYRHVTEYAFYALDLTGEGHA